jgi:hypothetical protein
LLKKLQLNSSLQSFDRFIIAITKNALPSAPQARAPFGQDSKQTHHESQNENQQPKMQALQDAESQEKTGSI